MKRKEVYAAGCLIAGLFLFLNGCDTSESMPPSPEVYAIGDTGPAGGLIFYIDTADAFSWTYLEAAPASTEFTDIEWGKHGTDVSGTSSAIGTGQNNTALIIAKLNEAPADTGRAAQLCDALDEGGYNDWFLPSKNELDAIWNNLVTDSSGNKTSTGTFANEEYWTSTQDSTRTADIQSFLTGSQGAETKELETKARAIRAF